MLTGKDLKIKRIILGYKVYEVAKNLGVHRTYISKLENGRQEIPKHIYNEWVRILK
jgi:transcriptional regulator with XRE-family HTH domain